MAKFLSKYGSNLPELSGDAGLSSYLKQIKKFPILSAERELQMAKKWKEDNDIEAVEVLVTSHLRLVASIAMKYKNYNLPLTEIIAEGNIGLMKAVKKFEPDKGFRLATYAMWWIKASIQEYILRSWSIVKISGSANQKKLFFNLRKLKNRISLFHGSSDQSRNLEEIAKKLGLKEKEVIEMDRRLKGDQSLNVYVGDEDGGDEWQDWIADEKPNQEMALLESQEKDYRQKILYEALETLNEREKSIFLSRRMTEPVVTLDELSKTYSISRERVRQLEIRAYEKLQKYIKDTVVEYS